MNSSIAAHMVASQNNASYFGSISFQTWMQQLARSTNPANVAPLSFQGVFTIPVCLNPDNNSPGIKGNGWTIHDATDKHYPCHCANSTQDQTSNFYSKISFADDDFAQVCGNHTVEKILASMDNPVVVEATQDSFQQYTG